MDSASIQVLVHILGHIDLALFPAGAGDPGELLHFRLDCGSKGGDRKSHMGDNRGIRPFSASKRERRIWGLLDLLITVIRRAGLCVLDCLQGFLGDSERS